MSRKQDFPIALTPTDERRVRVAGGFPKGAIDKELAEVNDAS